MQLFVNFVRCCRTMNALQDGSGDKGRLGTGYSTTSLDKYLKKDSDQPVSYTSPVLIARRMQASLLEESVAALELSFVLLVSNGFRATFSDFSFPTQREE